MHLTLETEIDAPAPVVWEILAHEFADIANWSSIVDRSRPITVDEIEAELVPHPMAPVPGRETVSKVLTAREVLVDYSDRDMALTFEADGLPRVMKRAVDRQSVASIGDGRSKVSFEIDIDVAAPLRPFAPLMKRRMASSFGTVQSELRAAAESRGRR